MVKVTLKDDVVKEFQSGTTVMDIAKSIGMGLYKAACLAKIDGETCDLRTPVTKDCHVEILTFDDEDGKRHFGIQLRIYSHRLLNVFIRVPSLQ